MTPEDKAKEIVSFVLNPKCANGNNGLGLLNTHNQRNADLNNINKCCEEVATQAMKWKDEQTKEALNNILIECDVCFDEQTTNTLESIIKHQIEIL